MKIGFYIHHTSLKAGGIFTYSVGILKLLINSNEIEKILLIISSDQKKYFQKIIKSSKIQIKIIDRKKLLINIGFTLSYTLSNVRTLFRSIFRKPTQLKILGKLSALLNPYNKLINRSQIDLLHIPFQYSPIYHTAIPVIITMHDVQEYHHPEYFSTLQKLHRRINNLRAVYESDHILVSFNHIKVDLLKYFNINEDKVAVCPPSFTDEWFVAKDFTTREALISKYDIEKDFILYPAATWKHKNHSILIRTLAVLKDEGLRIQLICTGNKTEYFADLQEEIVTFNLSDQVKFLGIVSEEDLIGLYKCTSLVVIPTKYEAGSGPLYEAMRYSVPVICSNVTSLPGTMDNNDFIFNPDDAREISIKIKRILQDENFRSENLANSAKRINELSKVDYTKNFITVYRNLLKERIS